ncbi:MAG: HNH endonuclease signature motif containing protein [Terriglobales bacterium]
MRGTWKFWQVEEGGPLVPVTGPHPWYVLARFGWRKGYRVAELQRHPICCLCQRNAAKEVDHIVPFISREGFVSWALFSDPKNHRALCKSCHSGLTSKYDGGFGNPRRAGKEAATMPTNLDGRGKQFTSSTMPSSKIDAALDFDVNELLSGIPD